ncbi:FAD:protein FMN transferase [Alcanivorax sp. 1008]|uniref:FAD:protein FMN transferase n=1 Tax=Alcanivorax sp. 1008 TaxID=2816853 RepID=UPI001E389D2A
MANALRIRAERFAHHLQGLRALFALCLMALLLSACRQPQQIHLLSGSTMGTTWSVKVVDLPENTTVPQLRADIELLLESINRQMSTYQPESDISRFNRAAAGTWQVLPVDFWRVASYSLKLAQETGGAFDPTVGPLVNLWGFGPDPKRDHPPEADKLAAVQARVGWAKVAMRAEDQALYQPGGVYFDLSAVAKGYAVDKVADLLLGMGIDNMLVEIGGELRGHGRKPGGELWQVGVEKPLPGVREVAHVVALRDLAIATSGDYRNYFEEGERHYSHILDPRTGYPAEHRVVSVSVLHERCADADALATALTVMGAEEGMIWAEDRKLAVLFMVKADQGVEQKMTTAFRRLAMQETTQ